MIKKQARQKPKFPYIATLVAFLAIVIMLGLGFWQLDRKSEKDIRIANINKAALSQPLQFQDIAKDITDFQDYVVHLQGQAIQQFFYIDNKLREGIPGFYVLMPYKTEAGIVMINLGWLQATGVRANLPTFELGKFSKLQGIIYTPTNNKLITETNKAYGTFPVLLQQVDLSEIEKHLAKNVLPVVVRLVDVEANHNVAVNGNFVRQWQAVTMSPEKHLGYAIQWFGLAIAALTIFLLTLAKRLHGPSPTGSNTPSNR